MLSAIGSGITEVIISPIVESIPGEKKTAEMSLLHSFYCWGQVTVVLLTTINVSAGSTLFITNSPIYTYSLTYLKRKKKNNLIIILIFFFILNYVN